MIKRRWGSQCGAKSGGCRWLLLFVLVSYDILHMTHYKLQMIFTLFLNWFFNPHKVKDYVSPECWFLLYCCYYLYILRGSVFSHVIKFYHFGRPPPSQNVMLLSFDHTKQFLMGILWDHCNCTTLHTQFSMKHLVSPI